MTISLARFAYSPHGTFGILHLPDGEGSVALYTVERPWMDNHPRISCIPEGRYSCGPRRFFRGGYDAVEVREVPGRTHILFHIANTADDVEGCIGVGSRLGCLGGKWAVLSSREAFGKLMEAVGGEEWELHITGPPAARLTSKAPPP